ncbi:hypothetical protein SBA2_750012 [Acidobacteriia bacterium SbA2]|nr:hypothetical protein SBA2_750012 [Acidobacteriia bacterium SbA2]
MRRNRSRTLAGGPRHYSVSQFLHSDFLEEDDVVIAVVLKAYVSFIRAWAAVRLPVLFSGGHGLALGVVSDLCAVHGHDSPWAVEGNLHGVPLAGTLAGPSQRFGQRVKAAGGMVVIGPVHDLHLVAVVDRHPRLARFDWDTNEYTGVVVLVPHFINHANDRVSKPGLSVIQQSHAPVGLDQAVSHRHLTRADMLPARQVLAVEKLLPLLRGECERQEKRQKQEDRCTFVHKYAP